MNLTYIKNYTGSIVTIINSYIVPVLFAIAFLYFLYGIYKYFILGADSDSERAKGRQFALWGVIGFAIIVSVWGLVNVVMTTLGLSSTSAPAIPTIGGSGSGVTQQMMLEQNFGAGAPGQ